MGLAPRVTALALLLVAGVALAETNWNAGIREGGGGFYISAPDQSYHLNFLGYGQFLGSILSEDYHHSGDRADVPFGFSVRRARLSALATVHRNFEFLLEMGTPTVRPYPTTTSFGPNSGITSVAPATPATPATPAAAASTYSAPDFGIVEARLTTAIFGEWLQMRVGKFIGPFSLENSRSARNLDLIERQTVLNSVHTMPALDTQIGAMLFGRILDGVINYYFAAFNGNSDSAGTGNDNNGDKEFQAKVVFQPHRNITFGFGWDEDQMAGTRVLSVVDHAFVPYVTGFVQGTRNGLEFDFDWVVDWFSLRTEGLYFTFPDQANSSYVRYLYGAYLQLGFMAWGDQNYGFQILGRYEWARSIVDRVNDLHSAVLGFNIFINSNVQHRINYICEVPNNQNGATTYSIRGLKHMLLNELQVKF